VRQGILIGVVIAALLGVAVSVVVMRGGGPPDEARPTAAALPIAPAPGTDESAGSKPSVQPPVSSPPSFDVVKVGPTGTAVIAGRAEPGARVTVRDGSTVIGEVTADRRGEWVLIPEKPIESGNRLLSLEASKQQGGATVKAEETVAVSVAPAATSGKGQTALAVALPHEPQGVARVLQLPDAPLPRTRNSLSVDTVEYDGQGRITLSGRATPGAKLQVYIGNEPLAAATANATGEWSAASSRTLPSGPLELRLDQLASDGRVVQRLALPFTETAMELSSGQTYVVQPGNSLWRIAHRTYGAGIRYVVIYAANPEQIRDPNRIFPGQIFKLPKT